MSVQTKRVSHIGGIDVAYQVSKGDSKKPTLVLAHSFMTSSDLYRPQFESAQLNGLVNLLAVDLLGHGRTRTEAGNWTYWDSAWMILQLLDSLKIDKFFALGTSQGGWVVARLAMIASGRVQGIIPLGTSMDHESTRSTELGCWDIGPIADGLIDGWTTTSPTPDFTLSDELVSNLLNFGIGQDSEPQLRESLSKATRDNYLANDGRQRARMAAINLRDRDGLYGRLSDVTCPVLWLHGTADQVYSVANAEKEIKLFVNAPEVKLEIVEGGQHFLTASHPKEAEPFIVAFLKAHG